MTASSRHHISGVPALVLRGGSATLERMLARLSSLPLFWQVFGTNVAVLILAFLGLVFAPVTVSVPPHATELIVLFVGLLVMLAINAVLLRRAFQPLDHLADTMRRHDPLSPGARVAIEAVQSSLGSLGRSTRCSTGLSSSVATAGAARCWCRRASGGGSRASSTTRSARR